MIKKNPARKIKIPHTSLLFFKQLSLNSSTYLKKTPLLSSEVQVRNKERNSKSLTRKKQTESPIIVRFCYIESSIQYLLLVSIHQKRELIPGIKEVSKRLREIAQTHRPLFRGEIYLTGREVCERLFVSPRTLQDSGQGHYPLHSNCGENPLLPIRHQPTATRQLSEIKYSQEAFFCHFIRLPRYE